MHSQQTYRVTVGSDSTLCRRWAQETSFGGRAEEARDDLTAKGLMGIDVKANVGLCKRNFSLMHLGNRVHWEDNQKACKTDFLDALLTRGIREITRESQHEC